MAVPDFRTFSSEWLGRKEAQGLGARTIEDYRWAVELHLLPDFGHRRLDEITPRLVDDFAAAKLREGRLSPRMVNKVLSRLGSILADAVEYGLIGSNPAVGRRRRLRAPKPHRPTLEPEQLMALLRGSDGYLSGRGRPLLSVLAGGGLRIQESLNLRWGDVSLARGTLTVRGTKTEAAHRIVDLTPAVREALTLWRSHSRHVEAGDYVFGTLKGAQDNRQNVRKRLLLPAIKKANAELVRKGIEPIGSIGLHSLRRLYASLRFAVGDDPVYTAEQLGHEDGLFTMRVYASAVKRRARLTPAERIAFDEAVDWALMGTSEPVAVSPAPAMGQPESDKTRRFQRVL